MAKAPSLTDITAGYGSNTQHNANNDAIEAAFENTLSLDGSTPNSMLADFDLNSNDLLNGGTINAVDIVIAGTSLAAQVAAAAASATAAASSASAASSSAAAAAASFDDFDDIYLGAKASDPSLDNDGDALQTGALYFNTTTNTLKVYNGSTWGDLNIPATFLDLTDTPSDYSGHASKFVKVNAGETALEFVTSSATIADADYGDITVSGTGTVWSIDADVIDPSHLADADWGAFTITSGVAALDADAVDAITEIASALKTGSDTTLVTGTAGTAGNLAEWDANGDAIDSGYTVIDDDTMATAADTNIPTSESVKAYVDANAGGGWTTATAVAPSGSSDIDFTSIPSGVTSIRIMFQGVGPNGSNDNVGVQLGDSGGLETTGYTSRTLTTPTSGSPTASNSSNDFHIPTTSASEVIYGTMFLDLLDPSTNLWVSSYSIVNSITTKSYVGGGSKALSAELDRVRVRIVGGTWTGSGKINIKYQ